MPVSQHRIHQLQESMEKKLRRAAHEVLALTGLSNDELEAVTALLTAPEDVPIPPDVSPTVQAVLEAARVAFERLRRRFKTILQMFEGGRLNLSSQLVIQLLPLDTTTFFWARCSALLATAPASVDPSPNGLAARAPGGSVDGADAGTGGVDVERAVLESARLLANELELNEADVIVALEGHTVSIGPQETVLVEVATRVRKSLGATPSNGGPPFHIASAMRAAYACARWAGIKKLPLEFLAAILFKMGIHDAYFESFERFVEELPKPAVPEVKRLLTDLRPLLGPHASGS